MPTPMVNKEFVFYRRSNTEKLEDVCIKNYRHYSVYVSVVHCAF